MSKLLESRLAVAALLIPILYFSIAVLPIPLFALLLAAATLMAQYEFYRLYYREMSSSIYFGLGCALFLLSLFYLRPPLSLGIALVFILMAIFIFHLFLHRGIPLSLTDSAVIFIGVVYLAGFLGTLIPIRRQEPGGGLIFFLLFIVWGGDAGAYYIGRWIGGKKLCPTISPNKTVSGSIGGFFFSLLGGLLAKAVFLPDFSWEATIVLSLLLGGGGQLGDLVESMFKRSAGVKDSGALIPAHGGLLDKLDGVAFAAPLLYYYATWIR